MRLAERHGDSEKETVTLMVEIGINIYHSASEGGDKISWSLETTGPLEMVIPGCGEILSPWYIRVSLRSAP